MKPAWLDRMPLATGVIRRGSFIYANDALVALAGVPREALIGEPFIHRVVPEDRDRMSDRHERRLRGEPVPDSYEFTFLRHDGSRRRLEIWVSTDADGDVIFQLHDRTDRALRHDKLAGLAQLGAAVQIERDEARIFEALGRGLVDLGAAIVRLAPSSAEMRVIEARAPGDQLARFEAKIGRRVVDIVGAWGPGAATAWREGSAYLDDLPLGVGRFLARDPSAFQGALEGARASLFPRAVMLRVDREGRAHQLLVVMASWLLPEDLPACRLFAAQVSAALDLTRAQQKLVERERLAAIGELSAVVAHEVRNPLGVLFNSIGAIRKLLGKSADPSVDTLLAIMDEESTRLNHIVGDLLDFARPKIPALTRERLDLVVLEAIDVPRTDVYVVRAIADVPPLPLDPRLMRQALQNLITNALQAMPSGGTLTVRVGLDAGRARVDIEDTGLGIAPDVEDHIFEPFFTTRASGTGLGLAVVKRIIEGHRGQLDVKSVEGRGTTFTLWLPVDEERVSEPEIEPPSRV